MDNVFYFVDLPGYGYSKMSKEEQQKVGIFIENYLEKREEIKLIIFVIDIRHAPTENDRLMYNYIISTGIPCLIVANKCDKIAPTKINSYVANLQEALNPLHDIVFLPFSAENKIYCNSIWEQLQKKIY